MTSADGGRFNLLKGPVEFDCDDDDKPEGVLVTPADDGTETDSKIFQVVWTDSAMRHEQSDDLPKPTTVISVGWLAENTDECVVIVRDQHTDPASYRWRGSLAIPRSAIQLLREIGRGDGT